MRSTGGCVCGVGGGGGGAVAGLKKNQTQARVRSRSIYVILNGKKCLDLIIFYIQEDTLCKGSAIVC